MIANPEGKAWSFAQKVYETLATESNEFELVPVEIRKFRDGECKPKITKNVRRRECYFIHDSNQEPAQWLLELALINHTLKNSSATQVIDVLPYLKFSRQDRKDESRVPISARVVADITKEYADRVMTLDVHNPAIQGFYEIPFDNLHSFPTVIDYMQKNCPSLLEDVVVMSTDTGGAPRAKSFARKIGAELVVGYKVREKAGEVEDLKILGTVRGKKVLMIDDLIESGGTLSKASSAAKEVGGATHTYAYCAHGLFTKGIDSVVDVFDRVFISDTVYQPPHSKLETISFAPLFAQAILRTTQGDSLSELFT